MANPSSMTLTSSLISDPAMANPLSTIPASPFITDLTMANLSFMTITFPLIPDSVAGISSKTAGILGTIMGKGDGSLKSCLYYNGRNWYICTCPLEEVLPKGPHKGYNTDYLKQDEQKCNNMVT